MMSRDETVARLIQILESARARPAMYLGVAGVNEAVSWTHGFATAAKVLLGDRDEFEIRRRVLTARGWEWSARHPSEEMVERGLSPAAVVDELLWIESEVLRLGLAP